MTAEYVVLGASGQLGRAWTQQLGNRARVFSRGEIDLRQANFIKPLKSLHPKAIINASAYTQVDKAEGAGRDEAFRVNAEAVGELAQWCAKRDLPLVHYSTDYVFDGSGNAPHDENAPTHPLNAYGASKLAGEEAVRASGAKHLIFRTSWVYDASGKNFLNTMLRLFSEKETIDVVDDQIGAPTYALHLASMSCQILEKSLQMPIFPSGVYHLCNHGHTSWYGFAQAIFTLARERDSGIRCRQINPIPTRAYPTPARRPLNSRLDCQKAQKQFAIHMPDWEEGLAGCIDKKYGH